MRYTRRLGLALAALLAAACSDSTAPAGVGTVTILGAPSAPLTAGDSVALSTSVQDVRGSAVTGATVSWLSTAPTVATVSGSGELKAVGPGTTQIVASVEGVADTVAVTVQAKVVTAGCAAGGLPLVVGEIRSVDPVADPVACIGAASAAAEYVLVAFNGQVTGTLNLSFSAGTGSQALLSPSPAAPSARTSLLRASASRSLDHSFELSLRAREAKELKRYLPGLRARRDAAMRPSLSITAGVPAVGDRMRINTNSDDACGSPTLHTGRVAAVTKYAVVVSDTANPAGGFTDAEYQAIGQSFDDLVYPVDTGNFGKPGADLDANGGRVVIFYTRAVNELTDPNSDSFIGGFFYARDLFPPTTQGDYEACASSNYSELFYVLAPDPNGAINGNKRAKADVRDATLATIAHEFQHLINASRRLYEIKTDNWDEVVWLNEGLSHVAEELVFYGASGLAPRQDISLTTLQATGAKGVDAFNQHAIDNFFRLEEWLRDPGSQSPYADNDELATRGATWSFLRYAADRQAADQPAFWNRLVGSSLTGMENLKAALGTEPIPLVRDWSVAMYADGLLPGAPAVYQQPSWDFRSIYPVITSDSSYPLSVHTLGSATQQVSVVAGGAAYFRATTSGTAVSAVHVRSGGAAPPSALSLFVIRSK